MFFDLKKKGFVPDGHGKTYEKVHSLDYDKINLKALSFFQELEKLNMAKKIYTEEQERIK